MARNFVARVAGRMGRRPVELSDDALRALQRHTYPGNVRELMNIIERVSILSEGRSVTAEDVAGMEPVRRTPSLYRPGASYGDLMREAEARILSAAIDAHDGNKSATARALGVDRSHFFKKLRELGLGAD